MMKKVMIGLMALITMAAMVSCKEKGVTAQNTNDGFKEIQVNPVEVKEIEYNDGWGHTETVITEQIITEQIITEAVLTEPTIVETTVTMPSEYYEELEFNSQHNVYFGVE